MAVVCVWASFIIIIISIIMTIIIIAITIIIAIAIIIIIIIIIVVELASDYGSFDLAESTACLWGRPHGRPRRSVAFWAAVDGFAASIKELDDDDDDDGDDDNDGDGDDDDGDNDDEDVADDGERRPIQTTSSKPTGHNTNSKL